MLVAALMTAEASPAAVELWNSTVSTITDPIDPGFVHAFQRSTPSRYLRNSGRGRHGEVSSFQPGSGEPHVGLRGASRRASIAMAHHPDGVGTHDAICSAANRRYCAKSIPYSRLVVYEDAGHAPHWEEPARFAGDLVDFADFVVGPVRRPEAAERSIRSSQRRG